MSIAVPKRGAGGGLAAVAGALEAGSFHSGINTECIQFLRQLWNLHEQLDEFLLHPLRLFLSQARALVRSSHHPTTQPTKPAPNDPAPTFPPSPTSPFPPSPTTHLPSLPPILGEGSPGGTAEGVGGINLSSQLCQLSLQLKSMMENVGEAEVQFLALSQYQAHCKLVLYAKICQAKDQLSHDRLAVLTSTSALIETWMEVLWLHRDKLLHNLHTELVALAKLAQVYNWSLESALMEPLHPQHAHNPSPADPKVNNPGQTAGSKGQSGTGAGTGGTAAAATTTAAAAAATLKMQNGGAAMTNRVKILSQLDRANNNDSPLLRLSLKSLPATRLLECLAGRRAHELSFTLSQSLGKVMTMSASAMADTTLASQLTGFLQEQNLILKQVEELGSSFSATPSLLGRAAVKKTENGTNRLSKSARHKMNSFFGEILWTSLGEISEDTLLWAFQLHNCIPLALKPLHQLSAIAHITLQHTQRNTHALKPEVETDADVLPGSLATALESILGGISSFVHLSTWDEQILAGLTIAQRLKRPEQVELRRNPRNEEWSSDIGREFGEITRACLVLVKESSDRGAALDVNSGSVFLECSLADEGAIIFRLEGTLAYLNSWMVRRAKVWLNAWAVPQFVACSQRDSALIHKLVQTQTMILRTRELLLTSENVSLRLAALHRQMCAEDLLTTAAKLFSMPDDLLLAVRPVAQTLSLATLQSYMPAPLHWRGVGPTSGLDPDKPSPYVAVFIDRVVEPVISALVEFVGWAVQEAMGKQVVQAACEAWLQYILEKKIHFSEWGAVQLLRDFSSLRDWVADESKNSLHAEARKSILQLEVLKRCEGVAYLLLRSPGDVLGVGKPTRKTRRVAPSSSNPSSPDSGDFSPSVSMNSIGADDIPPEMYVPNQQMWLELRLRRSLLSSCCQ